MARTVARLLAESLEAHDVDQVYCVPGESYVGLTSALIERNSIRVIVCRHEGGAGYMAVADGRLRDRAGVAMVSRGQGCRMRWCHCIRPTTTRPRWSCSWARWSARISAGWRCRNRTILACFQT